MSDIEGLFNLKANIADKLEFDNIYNVFLSASHTAMIFAELGDRLISQTCSELNLTVDQTFKTALPN